MDSTIRERSENFTFDQRQFLMNLIKEHETTVESKEGGNSILVQKTKLWDAIKCQFNANFVHC